MESSYIYDALGQLTEFTRGDYSESYTYDPAGNMLEKTAGGIKTQYTYNAANQLVSDGTYEYTYDRIGNLVEKAGNGGLVSYTYNALNLLEQWTDGESNESYTYNAAGLLSTVKTNTSTTTLTWDILTGDGVVISAENNGTVTDYTYGLERISANTGRARTEYVYDARGSVIGEVTKAGLLSKTAVTVKAYTPFGEQIGEATSGFGWNGEYYNAVTGQVYLRARFYEPEMNRFSQKDVLRGNVFSGTSLNRYLYCGDDPVNFTDPSGMRQVENDNPQKDSVSRVVKTNNSANAKAEQIRQQALLDAQRRALQERRLAEKERQSGEPKKTPKTGEPVVGDKGRYACGAAASKVVVTLLNVYLGYDSFKNGVTAALIRNYGQNGIELIALIEGLTTGKTTYADRLRASLDAKVDSYEDASYNETMYTAGLVYGDTLEIAIDILLIIYGGAGAAAAGATGGGAGALVLSTEAVTATEAIAAGAGIIDALKQGTRLGGDLGDLISQIEGSDSGNNLKKVRKNKRANEIAEQFGYDDAEDLKEAYVFKEHISEFNMMIDSETGEIILESISDSSIHVPTGLFTK